jgi:hypothetical protein
MAAITNHHTKHQNRGTQTFNEGHSSSYYNAKTDIRRQRISTHGTRKLALPLTPQTYMRPLFPCRDPHAFVAAPTSQYVPRYRTYIQVLIGELSNITSSLLVHNAQHSVAAPTSTSFLI